MLLRDAPPFPERLPTIAFHAAPVTKIAEVPKKRGVAEKMLSAVMEVLLRAVAADRGQMRKKEVARRHVLPNEQLCSAL